MKVYADICLASFQFWAGAVNNANKLSYDELEQVGYMLEDIYPNGVEDVLINDLFWFDFGVVCEWLGYLYDEDNDEIKREVDDEEIDMIIR